MKTYLAKAGEIQREYLLFDASEAPVGRLAVRIANALRGKDKPTYTPHVDTGAFVIVINAEKAVFTGRKGDEKIYVDYTGSATRSARRRSFAIVPPSVSSKTRSGA